MNAKEARKLRKAKLDKIYEDANKFIDEDFSNILEKIKERATAGYYSYKFEAHIHSVNFIFDNQNYYCTCLSTKLNKLGFHVDYRSPTTYNIWW